MEQLVDWCKDSSLFLNVDKIKGMTADFRKAHAVHSPLNSEGTVLDTVRIPIPSRFLGVHLTDNLTWTLNTTSLAQKKAQKCLLLLQQLKRASLHPPSSLHSIGEPLRVSWLAVSLPGLELQQLRLQVPADDKEYTGTSGSLSPLSRTFFTSNASARPPALLKTLPMCSLDNSPASHTQHTGKLSPKL